MSCEECTHTKPQIDLAAAIKAATNAIDLDVSAHAFAALPDNWKTHDLESVSNTRRRMRGSMQTSSVESFAAYVQANRQEGATIFVDADKMKAVAVLNLGTEWAQYALGNQNFWTAIATKKINQLALLGYRNFCVTDLRFAHEERWLKAMGAKIWQIDRPNVAPVHPHISEQHAATPDWVCRNDGTLSDLTSVVRSQLDSKMEGVLKGVVKGVAL